MDKKIIDLSLLTEYDKLLKEWHDKNLGDFTELEKTVKELQESQNLEII